MFVMNTYSTISCGIYATHICHKSVIHVKSAVSVVQPFFTIIRFERNIIIMILKHDPISKYTLLLQEGAHIMLRQQGLI